MLLSSAEYTYNDSKNASTGKSPFSEVFRFMPELHINIAREPRKSENDDVRQRTVKLYRA